MFYDLVYAYLLSKLVHVLQSVPEMYILYAYTVLTGIVLCQLALEMFPIIVKSCQGVHVRFVLPLVHVPVAVCSFVV